MKNKQTKNLTILKDTQSSPVLYLDKSHHSKFIYSCQTLKKNHKKKVFHCDSINSEGWIPRACVVSLMYFRNCRCMFFFGESGFLYQYVEKLFASGYLKSEARSSIKETGVWISNVFNELPESRIELFEFKGFLCLFC